MEIKIDSKPTDLHPCNPEDIALKSFFLGPQAENAPWMQELLTHVFTNWFDWRRTNFTTDGRAISELDVKSDLFQSHIREFKSEVDELLNRFQSEVPSYSPRYIGHMISEVSLPALVGHILTLLYNPNNISGEVSRVGLEIEQNAIGALLSMIGMDSRQSTGHFTSGGTVANLEAALRARARTYRWLSMGAMGRKHKIYDGSLFEAAHMGWHTYDELFGRLSAQFPDDLEARLKSFHLLTGNPMDVANCLSNVFGEVYRGPVMLVPGNKHYSWNKASEVLGLGDEAFWQVETDEKGKMDPSALSERIREAQTAGRPIMIVVSVAGTTELGEVDPIDEIQEILDTCERDHSLDIWHHVDAAYGGFFATLKHDKTDKILESSVRRALRTIGYVNSVTIDPHKLGFVPYASGAFLCGDRREYQHTTVHAPYIDFRPGTDVGVSTLEGSRSAAGAVSTWLTSRVIGFDRLGYGRILERTVLAARKLGFGLMEAHPDIRVNRAGDTNIVTYCVARKGEKVSHTNERTRKIYEHFSTGSKNKLETSKNKNQRNTDHTGQNTSHDHQTRYSNQNAKESFFISKTTLDMESYSRLLVDFGQTWDADWDTGELVLLRMVLLNPFLDTKEANIRYIETFIQELVQQID